MPKSPGYGRFWDLFDYAKSKGLIDKAAYAYATLGWWGEHWGITTPRMTSGRRDPEVQIRLWRERKSNPYPVAYPGTSKHEKGQAWDWPLVPQLDWYGNIAHFVGCTWGGKFSRPDPIHFEIQE